jgi:sporulation protein YlmC with PRC-barrel domain
MNRFATSLIAKPVIVNREEALIGMIEDLVIDPENGHFEGILVKEIFGKRNIKAISAKDILGITDKFFLIDSYEDLGEIEDIVRIKKVTATGIKILENKAYTVRGKYLGKVYDYTVDPDFAILTKIYVRPTSFHPLSADYIIPFEEIISIEKNRITISDGAVYNKKVIKLGKPAKPESAI